MSDFDYLTDGIEQVRALQDHIIYIGALRQVNDNSIEFLQMIADVQETGRIIKPVHGRYLTIPTPIAGKHRAGDFDNLFFHLTKGSNHPSLARVDDGQLHVYFLLKTQVTIPARSFLRTTLEKGTWQESANMLARGTQQLLCGQLTSYRTVLDAIGKYMARQVKRTMIQKSSPKNATITKLNKHNDNPLIDTGALLHSIDWTVV